MASITNSKVVLITGASSGMGDKAVADHRQLGARHSMAIHFGTFPLADDGEREPVERLDRSLREAGLSRDDLWVLDFGEGRNVPQPGRGSE